MTPAWANLLGLARRAGQLAPGENQVTLSMKREQVRLLVIAEDAGMALYRKYDLWAQDLDIPLVRIATKAALGHAIGMGPHAVLAILDKNFGERILDEMRKSSGGIILDRKRQRQSSGVRTRKGTQTGQSTTHRPASPAESRKYQESHEHRGTGSGQNGERYHGGKAAAGSQTGSQGKSGSGSTTQPGRRTGTPRRESGRRKAGTQDAAGARPGESAAHAGKRTSSRQSSAKRPASHRPR